jgi:hypothetical protein
VTEVFLHIDHLVYATIDLEKSVAKLEARLGVRAVPGGPHPGRGTRNALLALSPSAYLEIIGPDPGQPAPAAPRWFGIDTLTRPHLVTWAVKGAQLERLVAKAAARGLTLGPVVSGSRRRPDGTLLRWQLTDPISLVAHGIVPSVIDWGDTPHPARSAPEGALLQSLRAEHPDPSAVERLLAAIDVFLPVARAERLRLIATVRSPRGEIELD